MPIQQMLFIASLVLLTSGCTALQQTDSKGDTATTYSNTPPDPHTQQWRQLCFRLHFDGNGEADFTTDLILADRVIRPALTSETENIPLWRFHRRAAQDATGHMFSFFYYTDEETAGRVTQMVMADKTLEELEQTGKIRDVLTNCRKRADLSKVDVLSDRSWDPVIQKSWPVFIMGVSATWLDLIRQISLETETDPGDLYAHYAAVEERLISLWQTQGQHAYLHHLNAIFGYEPLIFKNYLRF